MIFFAIIGLLTCAGILIGAVVTAACLLHVRKAERPNLQRREREHMQRELVAQGRIKEL